MMFSSSPKKNNNVHKGKVPQFKKKRRWPGEEAEIGKLEERLRVSQPPRGWHPEVDADAACLFSDLPLSAKTLAGLRAGGFKRMRPIQQAAIPHALAGRDILGAARTGSGKTVAFLVPLLELLYRKRWSSEFGLGALIVSPTRELALQIFQVVTVIGGSHDLSAMAVVGGARDVPREKARVGQMSLVVATPGRILQHLEECPSLDASKTLGLVVDEADRAVDLGFAPQLDAIVRALPKERQTLLFSATLAGVASDSQDVSPRLSRLRSLANSETVEFLVAKTDHQAVVVAAADVVKKTSSTTTTSKKKTTTSTPSEEKKGALQQQQQGPAAPTPRKLRQCYVVCGLEEKLDVAYSFIKAHLRSKCIVFVSACAQARYLFEALRGLQPGVPLLALHGKQKQTRRTAVYYDFSKKKHAVLFATDVAARGLDFPKVDWIVQLDAPEDAEAYVHRAGRAARGDVDGDALLILLPSEEPRVLELLTAAKIPIAKLAVNPAKRSTRTCQPHVAALAASRPDVKDLAQKAFKAYVRSVVLARDKEAFRVDQLPLDAFARSLGLPARPHVALPKAGDKDAPERERDASHRKKNANRKLQKLKEQIAAKKEKSNNNKKATQQVTKNDVDDDDDDDDDDQEEDGAFMTAKEEPLLFDGEEGHVDDGDVDDDDDAPSGNKRTKAPKTKIRGGVDVRARATRIEFDDDGNVVKPTQQRLTVPNDDVVVVVDPGALKAKNDAVVDRLRARLRASEAEARQQERDALRERKQLKKAKRKREAQEEEEESDDNRRRRRPKNRR